MISLLVMVALMRSYPERAPASAKSLAVIRGYGGTAADPRRDVVAVFRRQL